MEVSNIKYLQNTQWQQNLDIELLSCMEIQNK